MKTGRPLRLRALWLAALLAVSLFLSPSPLSARSDIELEAPYQWYRYQGEWDSGPSAADNCQITTVAMAIQYAHNNHWVPLFEVRDYFGHPGGTATREGMRALDYWEVPYSPLGSIQDVFAALDRGHIVIADLNMAYISPGPDYFVPSSDPTSRTGRYYDYVAEHSVIIKGATADGRWLLVYDPNVWDGNGVYWYSDGTPKGKNRFYLASEVATAMERATDDPKGMEILVPPLLEGQQHGPSSPSEGSAPAPQAIKQALAAAPDPLSGVALAQASDLAAWPSSAESVASVTFSFSVENLGQEAVELERVAVHGRTPSGVPFEADASGGLLAPGAPRAFAVPMLAREEGGYQVEYLAFHVGGAWRALPAGGHLQRLGFQVGEGRLGDRLGYPKGFALPRGRPLAGGW